MKRFRCVTVWSTDGRLTFFQRTHYRLATSKRAALKAERAHNETRLAIPDFKADGWSYRVRVTEAREQPQKGT